jgi:hypothetical protein
MEARGGGTGTCLADDRLVDVAGEEIPAVPPAVAARKRGG